MAQCKILDCQLAKIFRLELAKVNEKLFSPPLLPTHHVLSLQEQNMQNENLNENLDGRMEPHSEQKTSV